MINILGAESSDALINNENQADHHNLEVKVTSIMTSILQRCDSNIFQVRLELYNNSFQY